MKEKIKVVLLCSYSDKKLRSYLSFPWWHWGNIIRRVLHMSNETDYAVWDSNAIAELEKCDDVEVHVVAPHSGVARIHEFVEKGIHYHVFWSEWDIVTEKIKRRFDLRSLNSFRHHRKIILKIINQINPDVVHVIGVENKFYSMAVLDLPKTLPVIAQLQTLVSDERFKENCGESENEYLFDSEIEKTILRRADYVGTKVIRYREIISNSIKPDVKFLDTSLPLTEEVSQENTKKEYDFVYFAVDISKAADWAIEAFALTHQKHPGVTLDVVGGYTKDFKEFLDNRINELDISKQVTFEGKLPTHQDVIKQIRKSRFAVLPLKIDMISGTIREAMANGIPVVTTETPDTPKLNIKAQTVLIAKNGDFQSISDKMCELLENPQLAEAIRSNAFELSLDRESNKEIVAKWVSAYYKISC